MINNLIGTPLHGFPAHRQARGISLFVSRTSVKLDIRIAKIYTEYAVS